MDPWKIGTAGFGTLSLVLFGAVAYLWANSAPSTPADAGVDPGSMVLSQRPASPADRTDVITRTAPSSTTDPTPEPVVGGRWLNDPDAEIPEPIMERAREQFREELRGRQDQRRDQIHDDVDQFLEDENVDAETADKVHGALESFGDRMRSVRDQIMSGDLERQNARQEFQEGREELRTTLDDLLGEDTASRLREQLPGRSGGGGAGRRPGGGFRGGGGL